MEEASQAPLPAASPSRETLPQPSMDAGVPVSAPGKVGPHPFALDFWAGLGSARSTAGYSEVATLGGTFLFHPGVLTLGVTGDIGGIPFEREEEHLGAVFGTTLTPSEWFRLDLLGEIGGHFFQPDSGLDLLGEHSVILGEASVALGYVGLRIAPTLRLGRSHRFLVGGWFGAAQDFGRTTVQYSVETCGSGLFGGPETCSTAPASDIFGGLALSGGIRLGGEIGARN